MIFKNLLRRKTRTLLTLVGIAIGVAAVVAMGAMAEGFINSYTTILSSSGADIILAQGDAADVFLFSAVDDTVGRQVSMIRGVTQVSGVLLGLVMTPDVPYFAILGLDPKEFGIRHFKVSEGQPVVVPRQVLLGKVAAKNYSRKVGDNFKIQEVSFRVVGIYETGQDVEDNGAVISLKDAQDLLKKPRQVAYYQIKVERREVVDSVIQELNRRFPKLAASRSANFMDKQQEADMMRGMAGAISAIALLAGGLVMMNTMLMSVFERTREIGVLRALGWSKGRVLRLILGESLLLSLIGGLLGSALGAWMIYSFNSMPVLAGFLDRSLSPRSFLQAMSIAMVLGTVGGLYPAWHAAQLQPVEAMRYDGSQGTRAKPKQLHRTQALVSQFLTSNFIGPTIRNLMRQRTRTFLAMLVIGVGVGSVVAMGGMAEGMIEQLSNIGISSGELTVTETKATDMTLAAIDDKVGRGIAALSAVENVTGALVGITTMPGMPYFMVLGVESNGYAMRHFAITEGERLRFPREILLGKVASKNLKKRVGETLILAGGSFKIVGIYETGVAMEDGSSVMALPEAQSLFRRPNQVSFYFVKLRDLNQANAVARQIESRFREVTVSRSSEYAEKMNDMKSFRSMVDALSALSMVIGGVGIMNAMLMSVFERTREIGTLRALGWRRRRIIGMILRESIVLSLISGVAGIGFGIAFGWLATQEQSMGMFLKGVYSPQLLIQAMIVALVLGAVGAVYPAWRAANLSPIEALRYE